MLRRYGFWILLGVVFAVYLPVIQTGFVWDDNGLITFNHAIQEPTFEKIWRRDLWCCSGTTTTRYYRPLTAMSFLVDRWVLGASPALAHLHNLAWHLICVTLAWAVAKRRFGETLALLIAGIFALHPVQTEAVVWVAARNDLMAAAGVLGTLWALDQGRVALAVLTTMFACLSKESSYLLPLLGVCWRFAEGRWPDRKDVGAVGLGMALSMALRLQATLQGPVQERVPVEEPLLSGLATTASYLSWLVWPWPMTATATIYRLDLPMLTWVAAVVALGLVGWLLSRGRASRWLLLLTLVAFLPSVAGVVWFGTLGERYLYLAIFGLGAALAAALPADRTEWPSPAWLLPPTLLALLAIGLRVPDWRNEETLFGAAVQRAPDSFAWHLLGTELQRQKRHGEALYAFDQSLSTPPVRRFSCAFIGDSMFQAAPPSQLVARLPVWDAAGCRNVRGYDGAALTVLAMTGDWPAVEARLATVQKSDPDKRDVIVRCAWLLRQGDLVGAAALTVGWEKGAADLLNRATILSRS